MAVFDYMPVQPPAPRSTLDEIYRLVEEVFGAQGVAIRLMRDQHAWLAQAGFQRVEGQSGDDCTQFELWL